VTLVAIAMVVAADFLLPRHLKRLDHYPPIFDHRV